MVSPSNHQPLPVTAYLGLGSNLGCRKANLDLAVQYIERFSKNAARSPVQETVEETGVNGQWVKVTRISSVYETEPWGYQDQGPFLNLALEALTTIDPSLLLQKAQAAEKAIGRTPGIRYGPRVIDIDILLYGRQVIDLPNLQVPHPRIQERAFVLAPLAELAPDLLHPTLGLSMADLFDRCPGKEGVVLWGSLGG